jgi:hypothetical protein
MEKVIITGFTAKSEGIVLETNIPAKLKTGNVKGKTCWVSWDKIGALLFENYTELDGVELRNAIRNNSTLQEEMLQKHSRPDENEVIFDLLKSLGWKIPSIEKPEIGKEYWVRWNPNTENESYPKKQITKGFPVNENGYCIYGITHYKELPDLIDCETENKYTTRLLKDNKFQVIDQYENTHFQGTEIECLQWIKLKSK